MDNSDVVYFLLGKFLIYIYTFNSNNTILEVRLMELETGGLGDKVVQTS